MILAFLQIEATLLTVLERFGFPVVVALAGLWFAYRVYQNLTKQVNDKDALIAEQTQARKELHSQLIMTQNNIVLSQNHITHSMQNQTELISGVKDLIEKQFNKEI